jgi:hypothetical protein
MYVPAGRLGLETPNANVKVLAEMLPVNGLFSEMIAGADVDDTAVTTVPGCTEVSPKSVMPTEGTVPVVMVSVLVPATVVTDGDTPTEVAKGVLEYTPVIVELVVVEMPENERLKYR